MFEHNRELLGKKDIINFRQMLRNKLKTQLNLDHNSELLQ